MRGKRKTGIVIALVVIFLLGLVPLYQGTCKCGEQKEVFALWYRRIQGDVEYSEYYAPPLWDSTERLRMCGERAGCKVVDIYCPEEPYDTIDGFHPTVDGMRTIADAVLRELGKGE